MKFLENVTLENLSSKLSDRELGGGLILNGRVEVYSTKRSGDDKKILKLLNTKNCDICEENFNKKSTENSFFSNKVTKKLLLDLIQTLNASSLDYDFSELSHDSFVQVTFNDAVQDINSRLVELTLKNFNFINVMWKDIEECMGQALSQCEVFTLSVGTVLDEEEDESSVWSFNYFFCNKELKRICFFKCIATSKFRKHHLAATNGNIQMNTDDEYFEADESVVGEQVDEEENESDGDWT
jgi:hypothetical protein